MTQYKGILAQALADAVAAERARIVAVLTPWAGQDLEPDRLEWLIGVIHAGAYAAEVKLGEVVSLAEAEARGAARERRQIAATFRALRDTARDKGEIGAVAPLDMIVAIIEAGSFEAWADALKTSPAGDPNCANCASIGEPCLEHAPERRAPNSLLKPAEAPTQTNGRRNPRKPQGFV